MRVAYVILSRGSRRSLSPILLYFRACSHGIHPCRSERSGNFLSHSTQQDALRKWFPPRSNKPANIALEDVCTVEIVSRVAFQTSDFLFVGTYVGNTIELTGPSTSPPYLNALVLPTQISKKKSQDSNVIRLLISTTYILNTRNINCISN